jgi:hypothetical protein
MLMAWINHVAERAPDIFIFLAVAIGTLVGGIRIRGLSLVTRLQSCISPGLHLLALAENALDHNAPADLGLDFIHRAAGDLRNLAGACLNFSAEKIAWLGRSAARVLRPPL